MTRSYRSQTHVCAEVRRRRIHGIPQGFSTNNMYVLVHAVRFLLLLDVFFFSFLFLVSHATNWPELYFILFIENCFVSRRLFFAAKYLCLCDCSILWWCLARMVAKGSGLECLCRINWFGEQWKTKWTQCNYCTMYRFYTYAPCLTTKKSWTRANW